MRRAGCTGAASGGRGTSTPGWRAAKTALPPPQDPPSPGSASGGASGGAPICLPRRMQGCLHEIDTRDEKAELCTGLLGLYE